MKIKTASAVVYSLFIFHSAFAFEGRITATVTRGGGVQHLLYTIGTNYLRVEQTDTDRPHARDIINLQTGDLTLFFPHNRSFLRLKNISGPADVGREAGATAPGAGALPMSTAGGMPLLRPPREKLELNAPGEITNLLGFACRKFVVQARGETMEIWATDQIFGFPTYRENQPPLFGPQFIEEQWGDLLKAKKLFPLLAVLKLDKGTVRLRFEVKSITSGKATDASGELFQPPPGYIEIQPLPF